MPTSTHDWTPSGYRVTFHRLDSIGFGSIDARVVTGHAISVSDVGVRSAAEAVDDLRDEVSALLYLQVIDEETASMLLAQLADHD